MLHAFHLENGRASYRNRWVRTAKWQAEHDAGRALFGGFGQKLPDAPASVTRDGGVANTNIVFHGGRLLALEEGHLPTEIEPGTLKTRGPCSYGGSIAGPFTAHPKIDPATGEMVFFGYNAAGPFSPALSFGSVNSSGLVTRFDRLEAPYASMVHDFIVTERHLLFPILPITGSMDRAMRGRPPYAWEPDKGAYVGVMKRGGAAGDIVWFRAESCYVFHVMNAWEEGERIVADVMQCEEAPLFRTPMARRPTRTNRGHGCAAGPSISPAIPIASLRSISTRSAANFPASTIAAPVLSAATAGTPAPTRSNRCLAGSRAWCMWTAAARASAGICCRPATPSPSRYLSPAARMPSKAMAGCWRWYGVLAKIAATLRCSTPPTSTQVQWRWCGSAIAFPTAFTATGSMPPDDCGRHLGDGCLHAVDFAAELCVAYFILTL